MTAKIAKKGRPDKFAAVAALSARDASVSTRVGVKGGHVTVLANHKPGNANPACTYSVLRD